GTAEVSVFALACHAGRAARPGHHGARRDRAYAVSGSRLPLTHTGKAAAPQASTADDGCTPCPARALREATRVSAGGAHPTPHRGYTCRGWASVDCGKRKSAPVTRLTSVIAS